MTERPILFSGAMVRALLDGTKTQTRRLVKPRDAEALDAAFFYADRESFAQLNGDPSRFLGIRCPYGAPGDRLWVRETWGLRAHFDFTDWHRDSVRGVTSLPPNLALDYRADWNEEHEPNFWRPSIHMPRWASRLTLEVTGVRVERLCDISEDDALAEGIRQLSSGSYGAGGELASFSMTALDAFRSLWESINGADSWADNPWVWVVSFKRVTP